MLRLAKYCTLIALFVFVQTAQAHPPGLSSADVTLTPNAIEAKITFAIQDIEAFAPMDTDQDADVTPAEQEAAKPAIAKLIADNFILKQDDNEIKPAILGNVVFDEQNNATITMMYADVPAKAISLESKFLTKFPPDHKQYLTIKDDKGRKLGKKMLTSNTHSFTLNLAQENNEPAQQTESSSTFVDFLKLGIEHILTGYDHLLFLFSLLVVTRNFWPALKIITFFTLAHSITLALASMNIINAPSHIVEPLIAASIVYVGLENIIRRDRVTTFQRCVLTFCFGLVHGFGFAGVLQEMNISSIETGILVPLFSFNLGVELGQITVAAIVLPVIWWLHKQEKIERFLVPVGSILTCLAGGYWLLERTILS